MVFPVSNVQKSSVLNGQTNGNLSNHILVTIPSLTGGKDIILITPAARSFIAMRAAAKKDGLNLNAISSYRPIAQQKALFFSRYRKSPKTNRDVKIYLGEKWYNFTGPTTASPGTSNHGWAHAIDFIVYVGFVDWMMKNAKRFGWSWEIQSENWHLRYFAGDNIPQAVLDYEKAHKPPAQPTPKDGPIVAKIHQRTGSRKLYICDGITKRYIRNPTELNQLLYGGYATKGPNDQPYKGGMWDIILDFATEVKNN